MLNRDAVCEKYEGHAPDKLARFAAAAQKMFEVERGREKVTEEMATIMNRPRQVVMQTTGCTAPGIWKAAGEDSGVQMQMQ